MDTSLDTVKQDGGLSLMVVPICLQQGDLKQLLDEVEHDIMNYQNRGLKAEG